jgi:hypothetical protein
MDYYVIILIIFIILYILQIPIIEFIKQILLKVDNNIYENYTSPEITTTCLNNSILIDNMCYNKKLPNCPKDTTYIDGVCYMNQIQIQSLPQSSSQPPSQSPSSSQAYTINIPPNPIITSLICPENYYFSDGKCISNDMRFHSMPYLPLKCPQNYGFIDNQCREYAGIPTCDEGDRFDNNNNICVDNGVIPVTSYNCSTGYISIGEICAIDKNNS